MAPKGCSDKALKKTSKARLNKALHYAKTTSPTKKKLSDYQKYIKSTHHAAEAAVSKKKAVGKDKNGKPLSKSAAALKLQAKWWKDTKAGKDY